MGIQPAKNSAKKENPNHDSEKSVRHDFPKGEQFEVEEMIPKIRAGDRDLEKFGWKIIGRTMIHINIRPDRAKRMIDEYEKNVLGVVRCPNCSSSVEILKDNIFDITSFLNHLKKKIYENDDLRQRIGAEND